MRSVTLDSILLRVLWNNLISIANEQARALRRTAFSPVVREAGDLAVAVLDVRGRLVANAVTGAPGHINTMRTAGEHFIEAFPPSTLKPGDQLITNDPWLASAHFFDIAVFSPIFYRGKVIGFIGSCIHHTDIGGYGMGAGARDVHEEGLWIPLLKLYEAGEPNKTLFHIIRSNVREPEHVLGDLAAQVSAGRIGAERIAALCERHNLDDLQELSDAVIDRSEEATRAAIRKLKPGTYRGDTIFDVPGGEEVVIKVAIPIDAEKGEMTSLARPHRVSSASMCASIIRRPTTPSRSTVASIQTFRTTTVASRRSKRLLQRTQSSTRAIPRP
jgi:N-methylhydantoinase B